MRIAFFSALKEERAALRRAWPMEDSGTLRGLPLDSGERAICLCSGVGPERMGAAVNQGLQVFTPDLAILIGYSAGLRADLRVGEVICDERGDSDLVRSLREFPIPLRFGLVAASGFLHTAQDKEELAAARPDCLVADLESEAFVQACGQTPHLVLRVVSDDLNTPLPLPFDQLLNARGYPDEFAILRALAARPRQIPQVWKLALASAKAQRSLSQTVVDIKPLLVRRLLENF